ncbi:sarcosine oxidase subunit alpha family protein [Azospirillum argentinense]
MSGQPHRLPRGGLIDRGQRVRFVHDGRSYEGFAGDSLAAALLANGVRVVGRSFKLHRPRGILGSGVEEPNGFVETGAGGLVEPLAAATAVELRPGLVSRGLGGWPSVRFDIGGLLDFAAPLLPAGFYYKTFKAPAALWPLYERVIRRLAGVAHAPEEPDPSRYAKRWHHADVAVVGGGPAGLAAALAAAEAGARVLLVDSDHRLGGSLLGGREEIAGRPALEWVEAVRARLAARPDVLVLTRATALGQHDHGFLSVLERTAPDTEGPRARLWKVRAKRIVLATGALERPLAFADNDRPGVMLAGAVRTYLNRYAVAPGRRVVVFTNNDSAHRTALELDEAGVAVAAVADLRAEVSGPWAEALRERGIPLLTGHAVAAVRGRGAVRGVTLARLTDDGGALLPGTERDVVCDLLAQSGGWSPTVHLHAHVGGRLRYDAETAALRPIPSEGPWRVAGAANGTFDLATALAEGMEAGRDAAERAGHAPGAPSPALSASPTPPLAPRALWRVPAKSRRARRFVDLHNDVTVADVELAVREGYRSVEHLKRYTTAGMGPDQGRTGNLLALGILAEERGEPIDAVGTTTYRPPYVPVPFGALAGRDVGALYEPVAVTPIDSWHAAAGAEFQNAGSWRRPALFPRPGEERAAAIAREALTVRRAAGLFDSSTLGKIELHGPDAVELLERVYANRWRSLPVGTARYGLMLRDDGTILDDGVTARLGENRYLVSTTSGGARTVHDWLEEWLQCDWPDLDVAVIPVTTQWASVTVAGPNARAVLGSAVLGGAGTDIDLSAAAFPHMTVREGQVAGLPARVFRVSFTGELSYEVNVPAGHGPALWDALLEAGRGFGIAPFGLEAVHILRAEKGYIILGQDTDGSQTPHDLGLSALVADGKPDFVGKRGMRRSHLAGPGRLQLVGLLTEDPAAVLPEGACIVETTDRRPPVPKLGTVTSSYASPALGRSIALALLRDGRERIGRTVTVDGDGGFVRATVTEPRFYDPEGHRLHA